ncbi:MAG: outer membrane beta-barrel protein, partial [Planctomycetota bacterium]
MKRWLILFTTGCLVLSGAASASVQQGDTELDFTAGIESLNGDDGAPDFDDIFVSAGLGYFISDNVQLGVSVGASWGEVGDFDRDTYSVGVFGKYHFMPTNLWVPYIGAQVDWVSEEVDGPGPGDDFKDD